MASFWLSFSDPDKPRGFRRMGVIVTDGRDGVDAVNRTHGMGINPGGEVLMVALPDQPRVPDAWRDRLLTVEEAERVNEMMAKAGTIHKRRTRGRK